MFGLEPCFKAVTRPKQWKIVQNTVLPIHSLEKLHCVTLVLLLLLILYNATNICWCTYIVNVQNKQLL